MKKIKRLFIENDVIDKGHIETLSQIASTEAGEKNPEKFFTTIIDEAIMKGQEVWEAILKHDEIYSDTALFPMFGFGSSLGAGSLFNSMMYQAVKAKLTGKKVFIFRELDNIQWYNLKKELFVGAFKNNELFVRDEDFHWIKVDIEKIVTEKEFDD